MHSSKSSKLGLLAFAVDLFSGMGPVEARRMFGGAGLYADGVMLGLIDDDVIYLKADEALKADLAAAGSRSWTYTERTLTSRRAVARPRYP